LSCATTALRGDRRLRRSPDRPRREIGFALFFIELSTRRVEIAGITEDPDAGWMSQVSRNVTDASDGFVTGKRYLIHDRDPLFTNGFRETLASAGLETVTLPPSFSESQRARGALRTERQGILWVSNCQFSLIPGLGNVAWRPASDLR
jgi:hypothetical protein